MRFIAFAVGFYIGLIIGIFSLGRIVAMMVRSLDENRPTLRLRLLTLLTPRLFRYGIPLVLGVVGGLAACYLFIID